MATVELMAAAQVSRSAVLSGAKWLYYIAFAGLYAVVGRCAHVSRQAHQRQKQRSWEYRVVLALELAALP